MIFLFLNNTYMNWSRKWKIYECRKCLYHGVPRNAKNACITSGNCTAKKHGREGVKYTEIIPNDNLYKNCKDCLGRSKKTIIKSALLPNKNEPAYSYDYNDYLKFKRKKTYDMKLPTKKPSVGKVETQAYGGKCNNILMNNRCITNTTVHKMANSKFYKNSAVSSGSRIDRLKLDTIRGATRCKKDNTKCNGVYPNAHNRKHGYKDLFNENHKEVNCPQYSARHWTMGNMNKNIGC